ncbi:hypothetical protein PFISCL1PPCAC_1152, partial [Pristionchus fissidentatus]
IDEGASLQLVPDQNLLSGAELYWQSSGSPISEYQPFLSCSEQDPNVVVAENERDLLMINIDETSAVQRVYASNGTKSISVQIKITRKAMQSTDVSAALTWIGIVSGFFVAMIVFVIIVRLMKRRSKPTKKESENPVKAA